MRPTTRPATSATTAPLQFNVSGTSRCARRSRKQADVRSPGTARGSRRRSRPGTARPHRSVALRPAPVATRTPRRTGTPVRHARSPPGDSKRLRDRLHRTTSAESRLARFARRVSGAPGRQTVQHRESDRPGSGSGIRNGTSGCRGEPIAVQGHSPRPFQGAVSVPERLPMHWKCHSGNMLFKEVRRLDKLCNIGDSRITTVVTIRLQIHWDTALFRT